MPNPRLASRYAKSLLDLAVEKNAVEDTLTDVKLMSDICRNSREFANVLRSPIINADKKQQIIDAIVGNKLHPLTQAFLKLLVSKGRESNMPEISEAFITAYKVMKNIKTAKLTTATPVNDSFKDEIRKKVSAMYPGADIDLKESINPELIGGFVLQVDDKLIDASVRRDLNDVKTQFLKNIYVSQLN